MKKLLVLLTLVLVTLSLCAQVSLTSKRMKNRRYEIHAIIQDSGRWITGPYTPALNPCYKPSNSLAKMDLLIEHELIMSDLKVKGKKRKVHYNTSTEIREQVIKKTKLKDSLGHRIYDTTYKMVPDIIWTGEIQYYQTMDLYLRIKLPKKHSPWINGSVTYQSVGRFKPEFKTFNYNVVTQEVVVTK